MKIYTEIVYGWDGDQPTVISSRSHEYKGEVAECKGGGGGAQQDFTAQNISAEVNRDIWETYKQDYTEWENELIAFAKDPSDEIHEAVGHASESVNTAFDQEDNAFNMANQRMGVALNGDQQRSMERSTDLDRSIALAHNKNRARDAVDEMAMGAMLGGINARNDIV